MVETRFLISAEDGTNSEGCNYSDQIVNGAVYIRGWCLSESRCLLEEYGIVDFSFIKFELQ